MLMRPLPEGGTEGDALKMYKRRTGRDHPDAICPVKCPPSMAYLWSWFWQVSAGRSIAAMGGVLPIPPSEILAWAQLRQVTFEVWELEVLNRLDVAFVRMASKK